MRKVRPRAGCRGGKDAAHPGGALPSWRERENARFSLLVSVFPSERFSSHLPSKTATIGVASPGWSHWAAGCAWKYLCVPSDGVFPQTYSPGSSQIAFAASVEILPFQVHACKTAWLGTAVRREVRVVVQRPFVALNGTRVFWVPVRSPRARIVCAGRCCLCSLTTRTFFWINDGA